MPTLGDYLITYFGSAFAAEVPSTNAAVSGGEGLEGKRHHQPAPDSKASFRWEVGTSSALPLSSLKSVEAVVADNNFERALHCGGTFCNAVV